MSSGRGGPSPAGARAHSTPAGARAHSILAGAQAHSTLAGARAHSTLAGAQAALASGLAERVGARWREEGWPAAGERAVVAVSGGVDSLALLHLLRFPLREIGLRLVVAHFDHAMREESASEAAWLRGLAAAWRLPMRSSRAPAPPPDEAAARRLRYRFFREVMELEGAGLLLTAHHADDQAETILFRILRGTGVEGLAGMRPLERGIPGARSREEAAAEGGAPSGGAAAAAPPLLLRPLLAEPRGALEAYVRGNLLAPRLDPTNLDPRRPRSRIRHRLLPRLEEVHPGAREALRRLGRNAEATSRALELLLGPVLDEIVRQREPGRVVASRHALLSLPAPVRRAAVRALAREAGIRLDEAGTEAALAFTSRGSSGAGAPLSGGARISRDFDLVALERVGPSGRPERPHANEADSFPGVPGPELVVPGPEEAGRARTPMAGRLLEAAWGAAPPAAPGGANVERFDPAALAFPLRIRGWRAGDRVRGEAGSRKVKKLFGELRLPREERARTPLVEDGRGEVIWIPGRHRAPVALPGPGTSTWYLGVWHVDTDL